MKNQESKTIAKHLHEEFAQKYGRNLKNLERKIVQINYRPNTHKEIKEKMLTLANFREQKQTLDLAENNLKNSRENLARFNNRLAKIKKEMNQIAQAGQSLKEKLPQLEKAYNIWQEKKREEDSLNSAMMIEQTRLGALKQELAQIVKKEKERQDLEKKQILAQQEIQDYEELALAFGKKGIQAMIIEQSLISIEEGANELLGKITDGRMRLKFITQKAKKSPVENEELIETLEIKIADELGERDYEMYSGGEAFRINFAIRIALSKLLASRAGTHLKFLAIDEGFGMLDTAGRDDLVAAINSIAPEFEKILVITHLQELKDLFPTKIEVTKNENGSQIELR